MPKYNPPTKRWFLSIYVIRYYILWCIIWNLTVGAYVCYSSSWSLFLFQVISFLVWITCTLAWLTNQMTQKSIFLDYYIKMYKDNDSHIYVLLLMINVETHFLLSSPCRNDDDHQLTRLRINFQSSSSGQSRLPITEFTKA